MEPQYSDQERSLLFGISERSLSAAVEDQQPWTPNLDDYPEPLQQQRASFVTLNRDGRLRGCIGALLAHRPLVIDIAYNARSAALKDPRFPPLSRAELAQLEIHLSILSPPQPLEFDSEPSLLQQLRPGEDGLILELGNQRGTFLPSVWESLPDPVQFLNHLKRKTGLPQEYWSKRITARRYTTESFATTLP